MNNKDKDTKSSNVIEFPKPEPEIDTNEDPVYLAYCDMMDSVMDLADSISEKKRHTVKEKTFLDAIDKYLELMDDEE